MHTLYAAEEYIYFIQNLTFADNVFTGSQCITVDSGTNRWYRIDYLDSSWINVTRNMFNCSTSGIQMRSIGRFQRLKVAHNVFTASQFSALQLWTQVGPAVNIFDNSFINCSADTTLTIELYFTGYVTKPDPLFISHNAFVSNKGSSVVNVICHIDGWPGQQYTLFMLMTNNELVDNDVFSTLTTSCVELNVTRNRFMNSKAAYEYKVSASYSPGVVMYAALNFWNLSGYEDVLERVYDHFIDNSVAAVQMVPFYEDYNFSSVIDGTSFYKDETANAIQIGGKLSIDVTLTKQSKPYEVIESIVVPAGLKLQVEAGVNLKFRRGGITVEGNAELVVTVHCLQLEAVSLKTAQHSIRLSN
jgi:hypothetical protein